MQKVLTKHLSSASVRPHNRRLVLQLLRSHGVMTRGEVARGSGLSAAAVTNVVAELLEEGLVEDHGVRTDGGAVRVGRPASRVALATRGRFVLSTQLGAGSMQVGVCDLRANILASESLTFPVPSAPEPTLAMAGAALRRVVAAAGIDRGQILGVGVGAAGLVDAAGRVNLVSHNLGWVDVPIADYLEVELDVPVVVDHNVRAMAMGESRYGHGKGLESLAFLYVRTGIGVGLVLDGAAYRGGTHGASDIGHLPAVPGGHRCACGARGCLETLVSDRALEARVAAFDLPPRPAPRTAGDGQDGGSARDRPWVGQWVDAVRDGHPGASALVHETADHLATVLVSLVHLLNPQVIVLGGLLEEIAPVLTEPLHAALVARSMPLLRDAVVLTATSFGPEAGVIGAATVALDQFLFGPPLIPAGVA